MSDKRRFTPNRRMCEPLPMVCMVSIVLLALFVVLSRYVEGSLTSEAPRLGVNPINILLCIGTLIYIFYIFASEDETGSDSSGVCRGNNVA